MPGYDDVGSPFSTRSNEPGTRAGSMDWGYRVYIGVIWGYRDDGKENGNYYITMGYILGIMGVTFMAHMLYMKEQSIFKGP